MPDVTPPFEAMSALSPEMRQVFDLLEDGVILTGESRELVFVNAAAEHIFGPGVVGLPVEEFAAAYTICGPDGTAFAPHDMPIARAALNGETVRDVCFRVRRPGREVVAQGAAAPIVDSAGRQVGAMLRFREIAGEAQLRQTADTAVPDCKADDKQQAFLLEASRVLADSLDYALTLRKLAEIVVPVIADWCVIDMVGPDGRLQRIATTHRDPAKRELAVQLDAKYGPRADAPAGPNRVMRTGLPELAPTIDVAMIRAATQDDAHFELIRGLGLRSYICLPLAARGHTIGVITLIQAESGRSYGETDLAFAEKLASLAAASVDNARLYNLAQHNERQLITTLRSIGDGVIVADHAGRILLVNSVAEKLTGWTEADAGMRPCEEIFNIVNADSQMAVENPVRTVIRSGAAAELANHTVLISRSGERRPIDDSGAPIWNADGTLYGVILVFRDVTERHGSQARLEVQYEVSRILSASRSIADAAPDILAEICTRLGWDFGAMWLIDQKARTIWPRAAWKAPSFAPGRLAAATEASFFRRGEGMPGLAWDTDRPIWITDFSSHSEFPRASAAADAGVRTGCALPIRGVNGILGVIEIFSTDIRQEDMRMNQAIITLGNQIAQFIERTQAADNARETEARKAAMLDSSLDCVVTMDVTGSIVEWNPAAERTFGWSRGEAVGRKLGDLIVPDALRARHNAGIEHFVRTGDGPILRKRFEITGLRADGSEFPVELYITPMKLGDITLFTGFARDITERKADQNAMLQRQGEIELLNARLRRAMSETHHRIKNNLQMVSALVDMEQYAAGDPTVAERFSRISSHIRALATVHDVLTRWPENDRPALEISSADILKALVTLIAQVAGGRAIETDGDDVPLTPRRATSISVIVNELIINAIKHGTGKISVRLTAANGSAVLEVTDEGAGFGDRDSVHEGTGIELVRHVARWDLHASDIVFGARPTGGATVRITFPLASEDAIPA